MVSPFISRQTAPASSIAMPEPVQTTIDAKADDELDCGTVIFASGRFAWARADRGGPDIYISNSQLSRAGIARLEIGQRLCFEVRPGTDGRKPWARNIRKLPA
jgi:cold shock CspA family protein